MFSTRRKQNICISLLFLFFSPLLVFATVCPIYCQSIKHLIVGSLTKDLILRPPCGKGQFVFTGYV